MDVTDVSLKTFSCECRNGLCNKGERIAFGGRQLPTKIKDIVKFKIIKDYE